MLRNTEADGKELIKESKDAIFRAIVEALDCQTWSSQKHAATVLHTLFGMRHKEKTFVMKEFESTILQGLPDILKLLAEDQQPHRTVGGAAGLLALSEDGMLDLYDKCLHILIFPKKPYGPACESTQILSLSKVVISQEA